MDKVVFTGVVGVLDVTHGCSCVSLALFHLFFGHPAKSNCFSEGQQSQ